MPKLHLFFVLTLFIFSISIASAVCEEGQIDINSASLEGLDQLYGIGPVKAQAIIDYRETNSFISVDDLIKVNGIGEATLNKIKSQGLACVADEKENNGGNKENNFNNETAVIGNNISNGLPSKSEIAGNFPSNNKELQLQPIELKSGENFQKDKRDYAVYGLFAFAAMIGLLFLIKKLAKAKRQKNELE